MLQTKGGYRTEICLKEKTAHWCKTTNAGVLSVKNLQVSTLHLLSFMNTETN